MMAWLHWDPDPTIFTVPFINHPLRWYGFFFVVGLMISYWIVAYLLKKSLQEATEVGPRDIYNWRQLIQDLKIKPHSIKLPASLKREIDAFSVEQQASLELQNHILSTLNSTQISRQQLADMFPEAIYSPSQLSLSLTDRLAWFVVIGIIIGARLGHVFFYDWPRYQDHLLDIFKVWEGGLASHGGVIGILIAVALYVRSIHKSFPELTFRKLLDVLVVPTGLAAGFIRIGNFFNQEIVGKETILPWGIIFGHPVEGQPGVPLHPVQLYEAFAYFLLFFLALWLWQKTSFRHRPGLICGLILLILFSFRFIIESLKPAYSLVMDESLLQAGQTLSIPFILLGAFLIWYSCRQTINNE
jgi:phosphatidylglycerol---prolipoprotein diacylglyceryl transferase